MYTGPTICCCLLCAMRPYIYLLNSLCAFAIKAFFKKALQQAYFIKAILDTVVIVKCFEKNNIVLSVD